MFEDFFNFVKFFFTSETKYLLSQSGRIDLNNDTGSSKEIASSIEQANE